MDIQPMSATRSSVMNKLSRIYVAGHCGLVGSAICRELARSGYTNVARRTRSEVDLTQSKAVREFFLQEWPEYVFLAAAKVGGIAANNRYPVDFLQENLKIQTNVIESAYESGVKRLLFLGSTCIYPKFAHQPIREGYLLTGQLEPTNRPYAIAKIAGVELIWSYNRQFGTHYLAAMPTNLYGPGDNFDLETSHVLPALIRKVIDAKMAGAPSVTVWGTGTPRREFMYCDDLAQACIVLLNLPDEKFAKLLKEDEPPLINIGTGQDLSIGEIANLVCKVVGYDGTMHFDTSKPDGTPRKLSDVSRLTALGWHARTSLEEGIRKTVEWVMDSALVESA